MTFLAGCLNRFPGLMLQLYPPEFATNSRQRCKRSLQSGWVTRPERIRGYRCLCDRISGSARRLPAGTGGRLPGKEMEEYGRHPGSSAGVP
jgi:hypothetical protein